MFIFRQVLLALATLLAVSGCSTKPPIESMLSSNIACSDQLKKAGLFDIEAKLSALSIMYTRKCYREVIQLGESLREKNRDKYYSLSRELIESSVLFDGMAKDYVLDSHERIFLSTLIALSYLSLNEKEKSKIELNRAYEESKAQIYNAGSDDVNVFIQGLLWLRLEGGERAAPFFKKISDNPKADPALKKYLNILKRSSEQLSIYTVNKLPRVEFLSLGTYTEIRATHPSIKSCVSQIGLLLPTTPWVENLKRRDTEEKDPIYRLKRALRLPAVALYSTLVFITGAAGTMIIAQYDTDGRATLGLGVLTIEGTRKTATRGLSPDMRNWYELPEAFYFTLARANVAQEPCLRPYSSSEHKITPLITY